MKNKRDYYFIQLNLRKEKHKDLIEMIKTNAKANEQSLSSYVIKILKDHMENENIVLDGYGTV